MPKVIFVQKYKYRVLLAKGILSLLVQCHFNYIFSSVSHALTYLVSERYFKPQPLLLWCTLEKYGFLRSCRIVLSPTISTLSILFSCRWWLGLSRRWVRLIFRRLKQRMEKNVSSHGLARSFQHWKYLRQRWALSVPQLSSSASKKSSVWIKRCALTWWRRKMYQLLVASNTTFWT